MQVWVFGSAVGQLLVIRTLLVTIRVVIGAADLKHSSQG